MPKKKVVTPKKKIPELQSPTIAEMLFGKPSKAVGSLASRYTEEFIPAVNEWKKKVRKHYLDGGTESDAPLLSESKYINPNPGNLTKTQYFELCNGWNEDKTVVFPSTYNPVMVDILNMMKCRQLVRGRITDHPKPPEEWNDKRWGSWYHKDEPSGYYFTDSLPRRNHAQRAENLIENPADNILKLGRIRYVVGGGDHDESAVFLVSAHKTGTYGSIDSTRKHLSVAGNKDVADMVFRIEDKPNVGGCYVIHSDWSSPQTHIKELCFLPGQVMTPGHLVKRGTRMTCSQIRKHYEEDDSVGIEFVEYKKVVSPSHSWKEEIWPQVKIALGRKELKKLGDREGHSEYEVDSSPQDKAIYNAFVTCRISPVENNCFGMRSVQTGIVPYYIWDSDGKDFSMGVILGGRSTCDVNVAKREATHIEVESKEAPEMEEVEVSEEVLVE